ncbi:MAG: hypothetical protein HONBIEJF_01254 [Fimbriimonadaceae bacterium]|nr:hypothetical protein [Fimbriimonadaceae bacterium]
MLRRSRKSGGRQAIASKGKRGFTLVEALVAVVLAGVGIVAAVQGISSTSKAQALMTEKERMLRLASQQFDDLIATGQTTSMGGNFEDLGEDRYLWDAEFSPTGEENLSQLEVTVRLSNSAREHEESVTGFVYLQPQSTEVGP